MNSQTDDKGRPYKVFKIMEGVVIDHIPAGKALQVITVLGLTKSLGEGIVTAGMNLESKKMGKKDVVKVEKKDLTKDDLNKIVLIAPKASINIIREGKVTEKVILEIPERFINLIRCVNPNCITRNYSMKSKFTTTDKDPLKVRCDYCEKVFDRDEVELL